MRIRISMHKESGQVMLISLMILGFLTLTAVVIGIAAVIRESQSTLAIENKALAMAAANACTEQAMDRLGRDELYVGNEVINVGDVECEVRPINYVNNVWVIETFSLVGDQVARLRVALAKRAPVLIESWEEVSTF